MNGTDGAHGTHGTNGTSSTDRAADGPDGYYPQQPYYAPGWSAPVPPPAPLPRRSRARVLVPVLGVVAVALVVGGVTGARAWADRQPLGEVRGSVSAAPRQLTTGHCVADLPDDGTVGRVTVVPCDEPHEAEVVGTHLYEDDAWPGRDRVQRRALDACEMDASQTRAGARAVVWTPSRAGWDQGDRQALCLAWTPDEQVRGSWTEGDEPA